MGLHDKSYTKNQIDINFDICQNKHGGNVHSIAAHKSRIIQNKADRQKIFEYLSDHLDGATCDELEEALGLKHQTCSARCAALKARGLIREDGGRMTRSGRRAAILKVVK